MDYKPYDVGDSLRDLDWRVLARADRLVVRRYRAETELATTIVFDASADLGSVPEKWETAVRIAATLAYVLHLSGEPVGLLVAAGKNAHTRFLPPRRGRGWLGRILLTLASVEPDGRAELDLVFRQVARHLSLRTLVAVVSDFMEDPATWTATLDALVRNRVDLRAFHVYDPQELAFGEDRPVRLVSPETGEELPVDPVTTREAFLPVVEAFFAEVEMAVRARRGHHYRVPSGADLVPVLGRFLQGAA